MMVGRDWTERLIVGAWTTAGVLIWHDGQVQLGAVCISVAATIVWLAERGREARRLSRLRTARGMLNEAMRDASRRWNAVPQNSVRSSAEIDSKV